MTSRTPTAPFPAPSTCRRSNRGTTRGPCRRPGGRGRGEAGAAPGPAAGRWGDTVCLDRIRAHWGDMLRVAGSLTLGEVRGHDLIRMLSPGLLAFPLRTRAAAAWFAGRYG
ncbi:Tn3 family transposase [Streptomyces sp. NPDC056491]|uniref:Tn3 family transposase n=1 Tax=Streptomyces sp. NPDC056491 TaxID=3345837 RepID=UPI0036B0E17D